MTSFRDEFPDFPAEAFPPMPAGFTDTSWHNDACPSISNGTLQVFIDYADPADRDVYVSRYSVMCDEECALATDEWAEVLAFIANCNH